MLQQTKVQTVIPYFKKFIEKYPNIKNLSEANLEDILSLWSGLGYYQRARNIHKVAQIIQNEYNSIFPQTYSEVIKLPGIGPYTAGAILSIAFNQKIPILDGNIKRVLARFFAIQKPLSKTIENKFLVILQNKLIPKKDPRNFNQAIMELGALICQPKIIPNCIKCPIHKSCKSFKLGIAKNLPILPKKKKSQKIFYVYFIIEFENKFLIYQKKEERFLNNFWDFLSFEIEVLTSKNLISNKKIILDILYQNIPDLNLTQDPIYHKAILHSIMEYILKFFLFKIKLNLPIEKIQLEQFLKNKNYFYIWISSLNEIKNYPHSSLPEKAITSFL